MAIQEIMFDFKNRKVRYVDQEGRVNEFKDESIQKILPFITKLAGIEIPDTAVEPCGFEPVTALI